MRLDEYLIHHNFTSNIKEARGWIMSGKIKVNDTYITKIGWEIKKDDHVQYISSSKWVSRGGDKLYPILTEWKFPVQNNVFLDIGASTGGFTDVLLSNGARKIFALDVAYGFLHPKLRNHPNVVSIERTHICDLADENIIKEIDYIVCDASFISLKKILNCLNENFFLKNKKSFEGIFLMKPQFEAKKEDLNKGILDKTKREYYLNEMRSFLRQYKIQFIRHSDAGISGRKGNLEYFLHLRKTF